MGVSLAGALIAYEWSLVLTCSLQASDSAFSPVFSLVRHHKSVGSCGATSEGPEKRKVYWIQLQLMGDHSATKEVEVHVKKVQTETINNLMEAT
jgi:hypothetical protein